MNKLWVLSTGLVCLAWFINENISPKRPPLLNWDASVFYNHHSEGFWLLPNISLGYPEPFLYPLSILMPSSKEEIVHMIKSALVPPNEEGVGLTQPRRIRLIGSGHSWSRVGVADDLQMSLENYKGVVSVNYDLQQVTVRGGTTIAELNRYLDNNGLAMQILGSISDQTVAGAISTGTHGNGLGFGNLAAMVTRLELVTGRGEVMTLSETENHDIFKAAQVSVGLLGVITEVTFQCEPAFNLRELLYTVKLSQCLEEMPLTARRSQHVKWWIEMHTDLCAVFETNKTTEAPRDNPNHKLETVLIYIFELVCLLVSWIPGYTHHIFSTVFTHVLPVTPHDRVDKSYEVFRIPHYFPPHHEGEMVVDVNDCAATVREVHQLVFEEGLPINYVTEVRVVKADDSWLSPNYQRDSCHLTLCIYNPTLKRRQDFYNRLYEATAKFNPRFHWGKHFSLTPSDMERLYPRYKDFLRIRSELDPSGLFLNKLMASTLGLEHLLQL